MKDFTDRLLFLLAYPIITLFSFLPPAMGRANRKVAREDCLPRRRQTPAHQPHEP